MQRNQVFYFRIHFPEKRYVTEEYLDFMSIMLEKDPYDRATIEDVKKHPWINRNRDPLKGETREKITVSDEEVKKGLHFFTSLQMAKKCGILWKKKSTLRSLSKTKSLDSQKSEENYTFPNGKPN